MDKQYDIFINYRRQGGKDFARLIASELQNRGYKVFLDFDELVDGKFDSRIMEAIQQAPVFITILSAGALNRCVEPNDWVRREIEYAIANGRHIVPINPDFQFKGFPDNIPELIRKEIGQHQFSDIVTTSLFRESVNKLVAERIATIINNVSLSKRHRQPCLKVISNADCHIIIDGNEVATIEANKLIKVPLDQGEYWIQAIPVANKIRPIEEAFTITDTDRIFRVDFDLTNVINKNGKKFNKQTSTKNTSATKNIMIVRNYT